MRVLGFDTATRATAVALLDSDGSTVIEARDDPPEGSRPGHASRLLELIADVLERSGEGWDAVDRIAVGVGPGTFTGLRIGVATAHALARAREIPLVGVSTLASLALQGLDAGLCAGILALLDARRGEAFAASWAPGADPREAAPVLGPQVLTPGEMGRAAAGSAAAVGDGAIKFREVLTASGLEPPPDDSSLHRVSAVHHCRLAVDRAVEGIESVQPAYLRLPDAEIARTRTADE